MTRRRSAGGLALLAAIGVGLVAAVWNAADPGDDLGDTMQATTVPPSDVSAGPPGASSTTGSAPAGQATPASTTAATPAPPPSAPPAGSWPAPIPTASAPPAGAAPRATPAPAPAPATTVAAQSPPAPPATDPPPTTAATTTAAPTTTSLVLIGEVCDLAGQLGLTLGSRPCVCTLSPDGTLRWAPAG